MFQFLSVPKALAAAAALSVSAIGLALAPASSAHAGVITVIVDDFNGPTIASPGTSTLTLNGGPVVGNPFGAPYSAGPSGGTFLIDLGPAVDATVRLNYGSVTLPANFTSAVLSFVVPFSNLGNLPVGSTDSPDNLVTVSGTTTALPTLPSVAHPSGQTVYVPFVSGNLNFLFSTVSTRSWDLVIDQVQLQIQCAASPDVTYGVERPAGAAAVSGLVAYMSGAPANCATVPVPASAALLLAGLAGLAVRRVRKS